LLYSVLSDTKTKVLESLTTSFFGEKINIIKGKNGEPFIENSPYYISISHSHQLLICALSLEPIGIDLEMKKEIDEKCYRFINKLYQHIIPIHNMNDWVQLEALVKLLQLRLDDAYKNEINIHSFFFENINIDNKYICTLSMKK
ncbi:4'-phosphopantetheinyl transferase family protein, partial [Chryseobacterium sp. HMWF001]